MLHCNMTPSLDTQLELEDLLADLHFARRADKLGRLALLAYCDCKAWARRAGKPDIADDALKIFTENPCLSKAEFLDRVDSLITTLERQQRNCQSNSKSFSVGTALEVRSAASH
jgi:hypothetical protein